MIGIWHGSEYALSSEYASVTQGSVENAQSYMFDRVLSISWVLNMLRLEYTWVENIARLHRVLCKLCFKDSWYLEYKNKTLWPLFMDGVRATSRRQFTFYQSVPRNSWYSFYRPQKDEKLSRPWSHPVVLNTGPLDWESSTLTTRPLLHKCLEFWIC